MKKVIILLIGISCVLAACELADTSKTNQSDFIAVVGDNSKEAPMTAGEQAIVRQKEAIAREELAKPGAVKSLGNPSGDRAASRATYSEGALLGTWTRQQTKAYYCGPTAVQVVADYVWGTGPDKVKYTQKYISDTWTKTDANLQTILYLERNGLNGAVGTKMPSGFIYAYVHPADGAQWHSYLRTDIAGYSMPQVVSVSPKEPNFPYCLASWQNTSIAPGYYGHYIVLKEYLGVWDGTRTPLVGYEDGSGGYGGSTGSFMDPAYDIYQMIYKSNPNHSGNWIIW
jgi:hypothetical protein